MNKKVRVKNVKCEGCASNIAKELNVLEGIYIVSVNIPEGLILMEVVNENAYKRAVRKLSQIGYPAVSENKVLQVFKNIFS